jgi:hypothetical protein
MNWVLGEGGCQNHYCPIQKIFATLRLGAAALKMSPTEPKMPLLTELENLFGWGLQIFRTYGAAGDRLIANSHPTPPNYIF